MRMKKWMSHIAFLLVLLQLAGCAGRQAFHRGEELLLKGESEAAALEFFQAVQENPQSHEYRMKLQNARAGAAIDRIAAGRREMKNGGYRQAIEEFQQAAALDPTNQVSLQEMKKAQRLLRAEELLAQGEEFYRARKFTQARNVLEEALTFNPEQSRAKELLEQVRGERRLILDGFELDVASEKPVTLKFKDAEIRDVFTILSRLSGINFIFDEDVKAQKVSILLENATFAQALELLLRLNSLDRKILNAKTILIYPQTKEKEKKFEDQVIQTFYLSNIEAKKAVNLLRTMLQLRKIYVHEELNALVVRDTPATVKLAQQIIEAADRSDSEVVFELELVEIGHTDKLDIGPRLKSYSTTVGLAESGAESISDSLTTSSLSRLDFLYTIPGATFTLSKALSDSEILANPKIRVKNKEKAKVHIGSREPIITNTLTASGDVTSTNVQYVDVGVKLDVEPTIQLDGSVITKLSLEVSSVSGRTPIAGGEGGEALTISTTNASTSLILKDGEQTVIGGLIRDDITRFKDTFPVLGQIPFLGSLLSGHKRDKIKREILLSITPHIVKNIDMPRSEVATIWSGGEDDLEDGPRFGAFAVTLEPEVAMAPPATAPALQPTAAPVRKQMAPVSETELLPESTPPPPPLPVAPELQSDPVPAAEPEGPAAAETEFSAAPDETPSGAQLAQLQAESAAAPLSDAAPEQILPTAAREEAAPLPVLPIPPVEAPSRVELQAPEEVKNGEEFSTLIRVLDVQKLYSAPLFVTFDPQRLEFVRAEEGDFLKASGQSTVFTASADPQTGRLIVGYKQGVGGPGASGSGDLFRLIFRGKAPGGAQIALERLNFRDPGGKRLPVSGAGISLEVR